MSYMLIVKCNPCIVLSVLRLLKHKQAVYSVKTKTNANLSRKHCLNYRHRCNHRCKRRLIHETKAHPLNLNHTTVYAHCIFACFGPKIRKYEDTENTAMITDLIVI